MKRLLTLVLAVLLLCVGTVTTAQAAVLTLSPIAVGNVFTDDQPVKVGLSTDAASVTWSAADVNGTVVATGSQAAASTLQVPVTTRGWYKLTVQAGTTTAQTTFAILGPVSTSPIAGLTTNRIGDFETTAEGWTFYPGSEYPGATGSFALDGTDNHSGTSSGKLSGNFGAGGAYVSVRRALPAVNATSLSFWAKSPNLSFLTLRLTDTTGQVHQQRLTLSEVTSWQPVAVTRFDGGKQYVHFGGADDGVWHGPAKAVEVVLDKAAIPGATSTTVNLDDLTLNAPAAQPTTPLGDYESAAEGWSFYPGSEFPGATGSLTLDPSTAATGVQSARLSGNFAGGGNYVALQRSMVPVNLSALKLSVKSSQVSSIGLRLTDATGQVHQQRLTLSGATAWQQCTVSRFDGGTGYLHFGGADDGIWHGPAKAVMITLDRTSIIGGGTTATVSVDAVTATTAATLVGAGTHFGLGWSTTPMPLLVQSGARGGRDEAQWYQAETTRGTYAFPPKISNYLQAWQTNGLDPLLIADYGNPLYDDVPDDQFDAPFTDAGRAAFANYADALATQFPQIKNLAIWNEWDVNASGPSNKTPESYLALLQATYPELKANHPGLTIVGGGDTDVTQVAWFEAFCRLGGLKYLDVVSIHPYNFLKAPESLDAAIDRVRALIRQYNGGVDKPIWVTESGWFTGTAPDNVTEPVQAMYVARAQMTVLGRGVERYYLYDFMNDGTNVADKEHNLGLVHNPSDVLGPYTPKPAYVTYATAARQLRGATYLGKEYPGNGVIDQVFAANDGTPLRAVWTASGTGTTVTVNATGPIQVTTAFGVSTTYTPNTNGQITVPVGTWPTYITGSTVTSLTQP
ncbi:glycosyl hydrolase [Kribbella sp. HUAS MG21]|uniref:Glycosyl hydrolase n=1 Tax=Kribbella sp. HUAS MG21 TaxID=3160966 RepID=A0AAU7T7X6_9ACTN